MIDGLIGGLINGLIGGLIGDVIVELPSPALFTSSTVDCAFKIANVLTNATDAMDRILDITIESVEGKALRSHKCKLRIA